ncbi:MAG: 30S ribosomal protein S20 [Polyangiaceae bacterium]|nr:30S ribosomal protein S20 [Polyangiaceae bacterium]
MANHASAEKRNRQRITRTERNRAAKSALRTTLKRARAAAETGGDNAAALVREAESALDKASKKGVIPEGRASRLKGRLKATKPSK